MSISRPFAFRNHQQTNQASDTSGSTAVVALITATHCLVANAGDSRAILITASIRHDDVVEVNVSEMSKDHTAAVQQERERIEAAGGTAFVVNQIGENGTEVIATVRNKP